MLNAAGKVDVQIWAWGGFVAVSALARSSPVHRAGEGIVLQRRLHQRRQPVVAIAERVIEAPLMVCECALLGTGVDQARA